MKQLDQDCNHDQHDLAVPSSALKNLLVLSQDFVGNQGERMIGQLHKSYIWNHFRTRVDNGGVTL